MTAQTVECLSPAKLNLFLHITGRRADGYHTLQTLFRFVAIYDTLKFALRSDGEIRRWTKVAGVSEQSDLCVRAARMLQTETGCTLGADIEIEKCIPMGGGLGGGSSDAATTLIALNRLWSLGLRRSQLMELGLKLGADVPVFVFGRNAFAEGVGEELQAIPLPDAWYVVLYPPVQVPTAQIFAHPDLTRDTVSITMRALLSEQKQELRNDMQAIACRLYPQVATYLSWLGNFGNAVMTGSGACIFAEFSGKEEAEAVIRQLPPDMHGVVAQGLAQHPLLEWVLD
jgi:4-diphosphocytidyl-2-C-methyl-D-erythritol kinase